MSATIWRFALAVTDEQTVQMPRGAQPLAVALADSRTINLWALANPEYPVASHTVLVLGTGNPAPAEAIAEGHVGTVVDGSLGLVWHVFFRHAEGV